MAYSLDLRERIVATVKEGAKQPEVAERFRVSLSSVERYLRLDRDGELRAKPSPGRPATIAATAYGALAQQVAEHNDASIKEHCELWREEQGTSVSVYAMCRTLKRAATVVYVLPKTTGWIAKEKKTLAASEQDPEAKAAWWQAVTLLESDQLVFIDEAGTHTAMTRTHARAPKGQRAYGSVPRNRGGQARKVPFCPRRGNLTLLAALSNSRIQAEWVIEGAVDGDVFVTWLEHVLLPMLTPGHVVVMDNLIPHYRKEVQTLIEARGCILIYLPPYSPDFSPIELAFSKIKGQRLGQSGTRKGPVRSSHSLPGPSRRLLTPLLRRAALSAQLMSRAGSNTAATAFSSCATGCGI